MSRTRWRALAHCYGWSPAAVRALASIHDTNAEHVRSLRNWGYDRCVRRNGSFKFESLVCDFFNLGGVP